MTAYVGFVDNSAGPAHEALLGRIQTWGEAAGWITLRSGVSPDATGTTGDPAFHREWIGRAPGLSGTEQIFVGFRTYQSANSDYYNLAGMVATHYVAGNTFMTQPGISIASVCAHNQRIDYWVSINGQRIVLALKVGTPVYESGYFGKIFPYAPPSQFPYPVLAAGTLQGMPALRYSDVTRRFPWVGNVANLQFRDNGGVWATRFVLPFSTLTANYRDTNGTYHLTPLIVADAATGLGTNEYGEIDGVYFITGFNNTVEATLIIDGITYIVIEDIIRTGFASYVAIAL